MTGFGWDFLHLIHSHNSGLQVIQCYHYSTHFSSSLSHTHWDYQSSLFISWHRIYHSLTVTWNYASSLLCTTQFLSCHFFSITFDCHLQNLTHFYSFSTISLHLTTVLYSPFCTARHFLWPLYMDHAENTAGIAVSMFTMLLPNNRHPIATCVDSCGNVFAKSLPSIEYTHHSVDKTTIMKRLSTGARWNFMFACLTVHCRATYIARRHLNATSRRATCIVRLVQC
jgi:hypothetical protein